MIEAKELRIGNLVKYCASFVQITSVPKIKLETIYFNFGSNENYCAYIKEISPIPITEEWLLKFGFKYINIDNGYHIYASPDHNYYLQIDVRKNTDEYTILDNSVDDLRDFALVKIKYIHQLQNIYFALTGEELTLSDT